MQSVSDPPRPRPDDGSADALLTSSPHWYPWNEQPGNDQILFIRFTEEDFRRAPFLDRRALRRGMSAKTMTWDAVRSAVPAAAPRNARWIFHISQCGSTQVSRLVEAVSGALVLREPTIPTRIARRFPHELGRLDILHALLARPFRAGQEVVVKASSSVNEVAAALVRDNPAVFLSMAPDEFLARQLSRSKPGWAQRLPERIARLQRRAPKLESLLGTPDEARMIALSWACEASAIEAALADIGNRASRVLDSTALLTAPRDLLCKVLAALGIEAEEQRIADALADPRLAQNAKAPTPFDRDSRAAQFAQARRDFAGPIAAEMAWLEGLAEDSPAVRAALERQLD